MHRYKINIFWSDEDDAFIADVPKLPGCKAHGNSQKEALENAQEAIELWLDSAREFGDQIPEPKGHVCCMHETAATQVSPPSSRMLHNGLTMSGELS